MQPSHPRQRRHPDRRSRAPITEPKDAEEIITGGDAGLVPVGREPYWALKAEHAFEDEPDWTVQYGYAVKRRAK